MFDKFDLYDHNNMMFLHLKFYAMKNIPPMRDLILYNGVVVEVDEKFTASNKYVVEYIANFDYAEVEFSFSLFLPLSSLSFHTTFFP